MRQKCCQKHDPLSPIPPSPNQLRAYLIDGPFLIQKKTYKDIRILYSLKL